MPLQPPHASPQAPLVAGGGAGELGATVVLQVVVATVGATVVEAATEVHLVVGMKVAYKGVVVTEVARSEQVMGVTVAEALGVGVAVAEAMGVEESEETDKSERKVPWLVGMCYTSRSLSPLHSTRQPLAPGASPQMQR